MMRFGTDIPGTLYMVQSGFIYSDGEPSQNVGIGAICATLEEAEAYVMEYGRESVFGPETPVTYCIVEYIQPPF